MGSGVHAPPLVLNIDNACPPPAWDTVLCTRPQELLNNPNGPVAGLVRLNPSLAGVVDIAQFMAPSVGGDSSSLSANVGMALLASMSDSALALAAAGQLPPVWPADLMYGAWSSAGGDAGLLVLGWIV